MDESENSNSGLSGGTIALIIFIIVSIVITIIIWYISGSVGLSLGLLFVLFIIGLIIYYFFFTGPGFFNILFSGGGTTSIPTNCSVAQQDSDNQQYKTCVMNCATTVGNCADNNDLFSCDRNAVAECEKNTCKSTCFPGTQTFFPLYGIGQSFPSTCENYKSAGKDPLFSCFAGCVTRTSKNSSEYCPCMNTNCEDIPITCNYADPDDWRGSLSLNCPAQ